MKLWREYPSVDHLSQVLRYHSIEEILAQPIVIEVKRDGENVSVWMGEDGKIHASSHHNIDAPQNTVARLERTHTFRTLARAIHALNWLIFYGELLLARSPTGIERPKRRIDWVVFDIYDTERGRFLQQDEFESTCSTYHLNHAKVLEVKKFSDEDELKAATSKWLNWCRRHHYEGVVLKTYDRSIRWKAKIELPTPTSSAGGSTAQLPPMPEEKYWRALINALEELRLKYPNPDELKAAWMDPSKAMPVFAKHVETEAREHGFGAMKNPYRIWLEKREDVLKEVGLG
ncbi:RNA ligase family protein [Conexivisphaera calida]|uniref:RNA ligase domain-containing protein n=1 Tax=Conexivisphaera calida TaxID=1874277 RepID=A0A4P2VDU2_9ARCH|nr:RNA ligase family protein [Conexivisphaera calida]BBE42796.1 hypothetical protein NAS2_1409 [Conexivisphaera calida]